MTTNRKKVGIIRLKSDMDVPVQADPIETADPRLARNLEVSNRETLLPIIEAATDQYIDLSHRNPEALDFNGITIFPIQYVMASLFCTVQGAMLAQAKKGFGKTLFALQVAKFVAENEGNCLIAVPPGTLSNWWDQCSEIGFVTNHVERTITTKKRITTEATQFYFYDPTMAKEHREFLDSADGRKLDEKGFLVIIAKDRSLTSGVKGVDDPRRNIYNRKETPGAIDVFVKRGGPLTVIVDEGHMDKKYIEEIIKLYGPDGIGPTAPGRPKLVIDRIVYMSGSNMAIGPSLTLKSLPTYWMKTNLIARVPTAKWIFVETPSDSFDARDDRWVQAVRPYLQSGHKIVVSSTTATFESLLHYGLIKQRAAHSKHGTIVIKGATNKTTQSKYNDPNNTDIVLHMTSKQGKGLNLNGELILLLDNELGIDSMIQTASRLIRPGNRRETIYVIAFYHTRAQYYKAYYASAFTYHGWELGYDAEANVQMVAKAVVLIRAMGMDIPDASTADRCVALANYMSMNMKGEQLYNYIVRWHELHTHLLNEKSLLNEEMIGAYTV